LPVETLYADMMGSESSVKTEAVEDNALRQQIAAMIPRLLEQKIPQENIPDVLRNVDLLRKNWTAAEKIIQELLKGDET
jgi:hypothetical protein